jgi:DNA-binding LacI/PurR family transcriptional regulator
MSSRGGSARSGTGPPTLEEVAALAGLSRATVSRAVNGGERVSPQAQEAVEDAVRRLGYTPNRAARSLVTRRTDSIAVVVPESSSMVFSDPFFAGTLHGVARALAPAELQMVLLIRQRDEDTDRLVRYLRGGHTDGAVVVSHHRDDGVFDALAQMDIPRVFIGRPWNASAATPFVDVDNAGGARLAVERLVARGCQRIGTVAGPQDMSAGADRLEGWRVAMAAAGLPDDAVVEADFTQAGGRWAVGELLGRHRDLDGIFVASDLMAVGALAALAGAGRAVPDDVAVVGFDDFVVAQETTPPLTTVVNPVAQMAQGAVELLLEQLAGREDGASARSIVFDAELVARASA